MTSRKCAHVGHCQHLGDDRHGLVELVVRHGDRRREPQRRRRDGVGDEARGRAARCRPPSRPRPSDELGGEQQTQAAHRRDARDGGRAPSQAGALLGRQRGASMRRISSITALTAAVAIAVPRVGRAVIARLEHGGHLRARPARADREPVAHRLGHRDDVGQHAEVLEAEPPPGAGEAGLHLVDDHQHAALVAERPDALEVVGGRRVHAALALHRFDHHRRDRRDRSPRRARRGRRTRTWRNPSGIGWNGSCLVGLAGRGERGERAAVEAAERRHDDVAPAAAELAGELERRLVGLGARVAEEDLPAVAGRLARRSSTIGRPRWRLGWRRSSTRAAASTPARQIAVGDDRVRVAERRHGEPAQEVEVALAVGVPQLGALPRTNITCGGPKTGMNGQWSPFVVNACALMR